MWAALLSGLRYHVKNANPSTPRVYSNQRFRYLTTPDANTYCVCSSAVTYFSAMSDKGTCSTPTPKCTSDSFFSLQTPHTTEQVNKNQGRHTATAHKQRKEARGKVPVWLLFQVPQVTLQFSSLRNIRHHSLEPMSQLGNSIPGFQYTTFLQRLLKQFRTAMIYKSPSHKPSETFPKVLKSNWFSSKRK